MERKATYIRAWRDHRGFTLDQMVGRLDELGVKMTGASLSRIERGIQPYSQDTLEAVAAALDVKPYQLLEHDPTKPGVVITNFLDRLDASQAKRAEDVLRAMFGTGAA